MHVLFLINISCEVVSIEVTVGQGRRRQQLLGDLKERIEEAIDRTLRKNALEEVTDVSEENTECLNE